MQMLLSFIYGLAKNFVQVFQKTRTYFLDNPICFLCMYVCSAYITLEPQKFQIMLSFLLYLLLLTYRVRDVSPQTSLGPSCVQAGFHCLLSLWLTPVSRMFLKNFQQIAWLDFGSLALEDYWQCILGFQSILCFLFSLFFLIFLAHTCTVCPLYKLS